MLRGKVLEEHKRQVCCLGLRGARVILDPFCHQVRMRFGPGIHILAVGWVRINPGLGYRIVQVGPTGHSWSLVLLLFGRFAGLQRQKWHTTGALEQRQR